MSTYTDDMLRAYLRGELEPTLAGALEQDLADDAELQHRLAGLEDLAAPVRAAFQGIPAEERLAASVKRSRSTISGDWSGNWGRGAVGAICGLIVGAILAVSAQHFRETDPSVMTDWRDQVAAYQVLYVPDTLEVIDPAPSALASQFKRAETKLSLPLHLDVLAALPGMTLRRAQVLGFNGTPVVQIAFSGPDGVPFAFCVTRRDPNARSAPQTGFRSGLASASWQSASHAFLIIGGQDADLLASLARQLQDHFPAA